MDKPEAPPSPPTSTKTSGTSMWEKFRRSCHPYKGRDTFVEFCKRHVVFTGDSKDYAEVAMLQEAFSQYSGEERWPGCYDHIKIGKHLSAAGSKRCKILTGRGTIPCYTGIHLADDCPVRPSISQEPKKTRVRSSPGKQDTETKEEQCSPHTSHPSSKDEPSYHPSPGSLIVTPLTLAHLSIPPPASDDILVMVQDNFDVLTAPRPPTTTFTPSYAPFNATIYKASPPLPPPPFMTFTTSPLAMDSNPPPPSTKASPLPSSYTASRLLSSPLGISQDTPSGADDSDILEALDILDDLITKEASKTQEKRRDKRRGKNKRRKRRRRESRRKQDEVNCVSQIQEFLSL